jgi:hypothetical protein
MMMATINPDPVECSIDNSLDLPKHKINKRKFSSLMDGIKVSGRLRRLHTKGLSTFAINQH